MNIEKQLEQSIKKLRSAALDIRNLPDKVGYSDPAFHADQIDREVDNLEKVRETLIAGRGTGRD
jgi:hypothetical protein